MKIGIVGAMAQEVEILSQLMTDKKETKIASAAIFEGKINGKEVALLQSGIGKVAAAIGTTALLQLAKPDVVLNTGSAGGVAKGLKVGELSDTLLFETSEKARYTELSSLDKMREWIISQGISKAEFNKVVHSAEVKEDVNNAINLTEEYGVFTFPYVVVGGKYVLTASTLYNDDYGVAVLDFLVNKLEQERKK